MRQDSSSTPRSLRAVQSAMEGVGHALGWLLLVMTFTMTCVVVLRYLFSVGSIALQEVAAYIHGTVFTLGAGYTLLHDEHVRVDVLYRNWTARTQAWVDVAGTLLLLVPFSVFVIWSSVDYVAASWLRFEGSAEAGGLPGVFVVKSMIPSMGVLLLVAGGLRLVRGVRRLRGAR